MAAPAAHRIFFTAALVGLGSMNQQVCGSIPANQTTVSVGTYTDSVAVVVTYN